MSSSNIFKVEDILSYPNSLIELFKEYQPHIFPYFSGKSITDHYDAHLALEFREFWHNPHLAELFTKAIQILREWKICAYHNTRVQSISEIEQHGLIILNPGEYLTNMRAIFKNSRFEPEFDSLLSCLMPYLNDIRGKRTGLLSFFTPYYLAADYDKFTENIGGEVASSAFRNREEVLDYLSTQGIPVTVEFAISVHQIADCRHETIIAELVRKFYCETQLSLNNYRIGFDAFTEQPIPPSDILRIIEFKM